MSDQDTDTWDLTLDQPLDSGLSGIPAFEPAGYRTTSSGRVELLQPNEAMRTVHNRLLEVIGRPGLSSGHESTAQLAREGDFHYFYILDLEDAFGCVSREWLTNLLHYCCPAWLPEDQIQSFISRYLMHPDEGLIQGAPASPILFEFFIADELDLPLYAWLGELNAQGFKSRYERYVDDMVFMSREPLPHACRQTIKGFIRQAGLRINEKKARGVVLRKNTLTLTGVSIRRTSSGVRVFMPRKKLSRLEGLLHYANQGRLVNMRQIEGLMSAFLQVTDPNHLNATELRVVRAYERLTGKKVEGTSWRMRTRPSWLGKQSGARGQKPNVQEPLFERPSATQTEPQGLGF